MDQWLQTDERLEAVTSLEMVCDLLPKVIDNKHYWKWVVISLHNALQGYMVLALRGSDSMNVLDDKHAKQLLAYFQRKGPLPESRMDTFLKLYEKIQAGRELYDEQTRSGRLLDRKDSDIMMMYVNSQPFKPRGTQTQSVKTLNRIRNNFIHFLPKRMLLEVGGLPCVAQDCIDIIAFLAFECGNILWHDTTLESRTRDLIEKVRVQLTALHQLYGV